MLNKDQIIVRKNIAMKLLFLCCLMGAICMSLVEGTSILRILIGMTVMIIPTIIVVAECYISYDIVVERMINSLSNNKKSNDNNLFKNPSNSSGSNFKDWKYYHFIQEVNNTEKINHYKGMIGIYKTKLEQHFDDSEGCEKSIEKYLGLWQTTPLIEYIVTCPNCKLERKILNIYEKMDVHCDKCKNPESLSSWKSKSTNIIKDDKG